MSQFKFEQWPTDQRVILQLFGANPRYYGQFGLPGHDGIDISAPSGSNIYAVAPGRVYRVHRNPQNHNYGIHLRLQHQDGYQTVYAHLDEIFVNRGDTITAGTILGVAGNTGNSSSPHLHFALKKSGSERNGQSSWPHNMLDPTPYLLPLLSWQTPAGPFVKGWMNIHSLYIQDGLGQVARDNATLHLSPEKKILVPEGTLTILEPESHRGYQLVRVSKASVGIAEEVFPTETAPLPPATVATIYGWGWAADLDVNFEGDQGLIRSPFGLNLRDQPNSESQNLGVVRRGSTVTIAGERKAGYLYVQVRRIDFVGPVADLMMPSNSAADRLERPESLPDGVFLGWITSQFLRKNGTSARLPHRSVSLRSAPGASGRYIGTVLGDTTVSIAGQTRSGFTPILVAEDAFLRLANPIPTAEQPKPINPADLVLASEPELHQPLGQSRAGWVLAGELNVMEHVAIADKDGLNLREAPRRDGPILGFVPPATPILVTDKAQGEFLPVRIEVAHLQPPIQHIGDIGAINPDPPLINRARIGLHASTDPHISEAEHQLFREVRPGLIKLLSFHSATDIARLAHEHPKAGFVIRAYLDMDERHIEPERFLNDTLPDVRRALNQLRGRDLVVELHSQPNVAGQGWGKSWRNGAEFSRWFQELLQLYRRELPATKFLFPGLSPGYGVRGIKEDHIRFIEAARDGVETADGLGLHLYWSQPQPMRQAFVVLDDLLTRFRGIPAWVTEASHRQAGVSAQQKGREYLKFWRQLQERPQVQGVTFFAASSSNPDDADEVWLNSEIGTIVGRR